jgi:uncharacterized protein (TIGR03435 family)
MHLRPRCTLDPGFDLRTMRAILPVTALSCVILAAHGPIRAQQRIDPQPAPAKSLDAASAPVFDVAAIHLHISQPHEHNSIWSSPFDGRFHAENISVVSLIHWAYEVPDSRILGAPSWAAETHFNIDASADPALDQQMKSMTSDAGRQQKEKMVQSLLADRFQLAVHTETREFAVYALVAAKGGPRLGEAKADGTTVNHGRDHIEVIGSNSAALLAEELSKEVGRPVIDQTGINGRYHLLLKWTPDDRAALASDGSASALNGPDSGPSLFTALEEQLGLRLEPEKGPVPVLVIDHISMPSGN